jgi:hypothetical protein
MKGDSFQTQTVWREPREESVGLYPGLVVHDGRVSGSITVSSSRLPVWAFIGTAIVNGWDAVEKSYEPTSNYGFEAGDLAEFLYNLLEARGEFGRLLLVLANAERLERIREDESIEEQAPGESVVQIDIGDGSGVTLPPPWWDSELATPVIDQLHKCLECLNG